MSGALPVLMREPGKLSAIAGASPAGAGASAATVAERWRFSAGVHRLICNCCGLALHSSQYAIVRFYAWKHFHADTSKAMFACPASSEVSAACIMSDREI